MRLDSSLEGGASAFARGEGIGLADRACEIAPRPAFERQSFDVSVLRPVDRFDCWAAELQNIGVAIEQPADRDAPFHAQISRQSSQPLTFMTFRCPDSAVQRLQPEIRRVEWNQYMVYREVGAGARFDFGGRELLTGPGDLILSDADTPFRTRALTDAYDHEAWLLPRGVIEPHLPAMPRPLAVHIPAASGIASLLVAYLDALSGQMQHLSEADAAMVSDNLGRLIAVACGSAVQSHRDVVRNARLDQARQYIDRRLASHDLDPRCAARALGMSVRQLHLIFEPSGESFGQYVRRRRLQECRATLESVAAMHRSVADIAYGWGFASLPTFYRAFSQAFGAAPGDLRPRLVTTAA